MRPPVQDVGELENLLTDLLNRIDDKKLDDEQLSDTKQKKVDDEKRKAEEIRRAASTTVNKQVSDDTLPELPKKRAAEGSLIELWQERQKEEKADRERLQTLQNTERSKDRELEERRLRFQEQQLQLDKDRFEFQKEKETSELKLREKQSELQEKERASQLAVQNTLIKMLLEKSSKTGD